MSLEVSVVAYGYGNGYSDEERRKVTSAICCRLQRKGGVSTR